jgi:hypothetical protein
MKEFERTWNVTMLTSFYVQSEENNKKPLSEWRVRGRDSSRELPNYNYTIVHTVNEHNIYGTVLQMYLTIHKYSIATNIIYSNNNYIFRPLEAIIRLYIVKYILYC